MKDKDKPDGEQMNSQKVCRSLPPKKALPFVKEKILFCFSVSSCLLFLFVF